MWRGIARFERESSLTLAQDAQSPLAMPSLTLLTTEVQRNGEVSSN